MESDALKLAMRMAESEVTLPSRVKNEPRSTDEMLREFRGVVFDGIKHWEARGKYVWPADGQVIFSSAHEPFLRRDRPERAFFKLRTCLPMCGAREWEGSNVAEVFAWATDDVTKWFAGLDSVK